MSKQKKDINKLTPFEAQFIDVWFNMNFNARLAYKSLKPNLVNSTCDAEASRILASQAGIDYVEMKREEIRIKEEIKLSWIVKKLKDIVYDVASETTERDDNGRITSKPDRKSAIAAIQQLSKIAGFDAPKKIDVTTNGDSINQIVWVEKKTYPNDKDENIIL